MSYPTKATNPQKRKAADAIASKENGVDSSSSSGTKKKKKSHFLKLRVAPSSAAINSNDHPIVCSFPSGLPRSLGETDSNGASSSTTTTKASRDVKLTYDAPKFVWVQKQQQQQQQQESRSKAKNNSTTTSATTTTTTTFSLLGKDEGCLYQADLTFPTADTNSNNSNNNNNSTTNEPYQHHHHHFNQASSSRSRLCVGIYDKRTHTLTLHSTAGSGSVWALQQSVPAYYYNKNNAANNNNNNNNNNKRAETRTAAAAAATAATAATAAVEHQRALFDDFGSSKKQRALRSQEANRVHLQQVVGNKGMASVFLTTAGGGRGGEGQRNGNNNNNIMSESNRKAIEEQLHLEQQQQSSNNDNPTAMVANATIEAATQEWRQGFLPKYNATTHDPCRIYDPKDMVGGSEDAWSHICRVVDACCQQDDIVAAMTRSFSTVSQDNSVGDNIVEEEEQGLHPHQHDDWKNASVRALLDVIVATDGSSSSKQEQKNRLRCTLLLNYYCNLYIKWHRKRFISAPPDNRSRYGGIPIAIVKSFLDQFATPTGPTAINTNDHNHRKNQQQEFGYCMSKANKDKCQVYMFLLFLLAESNAKNSVQSDHFKSLADDLRLDVKEATHLLRQAGCTVQRNTRTKVVTALLKAPVVFPAVPSRKRGGGGIRR